MSETSFFPIVRSGFQEIQKGISQWPVWVSLAKEDVWDQHRRTTLGPLWMVLNYFLFVGTFVIIFGSGAGVPVSYPAYVATGMFVWLLMSEAIGMGVTTFQRDSSFIRGTTLSLFVYVMRLTMQTIIRSAYSGAGWILLVVLVSPPSFLAWPQALLGLALILIALPACITTFAIIGAFFPDFDFIVGNLLRVGMFVTPIFWVHGDEGGLRKIFYDYNPFTYFLDIVRAPILGDPYPYHSLMVCSVIAVVFWFTSVLLLGALRKKIVYVI